MNSNAKLIQLINNMSAISADTKDTVDNLTLLFDKYGWKFEGDSLTNHELSNSTDFPLKLFLSNNETFYTNISLYSMSDQWNEQYIEDYITEWNSAFNNGCDFIISLGFELYATEKIIPEFRNWRELSLSKFRRNNLIVILFQDEYTHYVPTVRIAFNFIY